MRHAAPFAQQTSKFVLFRIHQGPLRWAFFVQVMCDVNDRINVFAGAHFDRLGHLRSDSGWIDRCFDEGRAVWVPVWNDSNLVITEPKQQAVLLPSDALPQDSRDKCILLGEFGDQVCFAVDLGESTKEQPPPMPHGVFRGLRTVGLLFPNDQAALLAYAQAMVLWHRRHRYCGRCGAPSSSHDAGHELRCNNTDCAQVIFPRIDPAIIVLIEYEGRALLGRQPAWPTGIYSTIAGFVEPGESLEDAVRREASEETGINVGAVRYHSSQPWPFPSSLMLGFRAHATDSRISLNDNELEDARWFSREDVRAALLSGKLRVPPQLSISSRLIAHWYDDGEAGRLAAIIDNITQS